MIERKSMALFALLLPLLEVGCSRSAKEDHGAVATEAAETSADPVQTAEVFSKPDLGEDVAEVASSPGTGERKIVKYIDFTEPKRKKNQDTPEASDQEAVDHSSAVVKATSYTVRDKTSRPEKRSLSPQTSYTVRGKTYRTLSSRQIGTFHQKGPASWYGPGFHGRKTASGEIYDMYAMTAAHKRLPLGTKVKVTNLDNGKSVVVRINDRGPFHGNRILDLSKAAAGKIGAIEKGVAPVSIVVMR